MGLDARVRLSIKGLGARHGFLTCAYRCELAHMRACMHVYWHVWSPRAAAHAAHALEKGELLGLG